MASSCPVLSTAGVPEGVSTGAAEGVSTGTPEGVSTGVAEGVSTGTPEGVSTGAPEGVSTGAPEGVSVAVSPFPSVVDSGTAADGSAASSVYISSTSSPQSSNSIPCTIGVTPLSSQFHSGR